MQLESSSRPHTEKVNTACSTGKRGRLCEDTVAAPVSLIAPGGSRGAGASDPPVMHVTASERLQAVTAVGQLLPGCLCIHHYPSLWVLPPPGIWLLSQMRGWLRYSQGPQGSGVRPHHTSSHPEAPLFPAQEACQATLRAQFRSSAPPSRMSNVMCFLR